MPIFIGMFFWFQACDKQSTPKLTLAVSSNMRYATEELVESFIAETGIPCEIITGSSGKLTAQIIEGAPFDVFLSADMKYPNEIYRRGKATDQPVIYAHGYLVFWSRTAGFDFSVKNLTDQELSHIAIANPETAPYGVAALELLGNMGILDAVQDKLVFGESISQTNQFILSGTTELGLTARSVVLSPVAQGIGQWEEADRDLYSPIAQGAVVLKSEEENMKRAHAFVLFLNSPKGREILHKFGYGLDIEK